VSKWSGRSASTRIDLRVVDAAAVPERAQRSRRSEEKRRRIGHTFIDVFEEAARHVAGDVGFLVQGTLYPDVIESSSAVGRPSVTIKTHIMSAACARPAVQLIEPLRELFKDEVREVGRSWGSLPRSWGGTRSLDRAWRPHPGPSHRGAPQVLRRVDAIYIAESVPPACTIRSGSVRRALPSSRSASWRRPHLRARGGAERGDESRRMTGTAFGFPPEVLGRSPAASATR